VAESTPILAAVVVPYRVRAGTLELYWVRRADRLPFLGGFWAFPGGRVEPGDPSLQAAAARELLEETGIDLTGETDRFLAGARTVTPAWSSLRYDASYFLVEITGAAEPDIACSGGELTAGEWVRPAAGIAAWKTGERLVSPVVIGVLHAMAPGLDGAPARMAELLPREADQRLWDLVPGIALCMLRTPTLPPATHTNCWVIGARDLVLIDPGSPWPEEQAALDAELDRWAAAGRRVREIWVTHHHWDHVSGVPHLAARLGVPVAAHATTIELLRGKVKFDRAIADGEVVRLAGEGEIPERRLRAVHTPGHTPGHHVYLEETTGFAIAGDMVAGIGTIVVDPSEGDMTDYLASLARMKALAPRVLLPAHGPVLTAALATLDDYTKHRLWREGKVVDALRARGAASAPAELVPLAYDDVPPAVHPLAERSLISHLVKLEKDGRVAREGEAWTLKRDAT
jgi:glyoxylase-like metal-dependent hydrolase (beta-lactamase superfamily II)/8-oxo-dGTP pyrophosphatase MutT (NUDIX family)